MDFIVPGLIALVILLGLVAVFAGYKGWHPATVTAAALLLLAGVGYLYLATRLVERERAWRSAIAKNQKSIDSILNGGGPGEDGVPLPKMRDERNRWTRALAWVDTWAGRSWKNAAFSPPRAKGGASGEFTPGAITVEVAGAETERKPIEVGAEVAVFDDQDIADGGRFLGLFRVTASTAEPGGEKYSLAVVPASSPTPPTPADAALWTREYEPVTVYESLPADRWLAFHRTPKPGPGPIPDADRWRPQPLRSAEETLVGLERQMEDLKRHQQEVPESEWNEVKAAIDSGEIPPGRYWASVTFTKKLRFTRQDKFALDDGKDAAADGGAPAAGAGGEEEEEGGPGKTGEMITDSPGPEAKADELDDAPPGSEPTAGAVTRRFLRNPVTYEAGETGELDLQTALEFQAKEWVKIDRVVERRPLSDPLTAIRGGRFEMPGPDGKPILVQAAGSDALRRELALEMESIATATDRVRISQENVDRQTTAAADQTKQLQKDLDSWQKDVAAAATLAQAFDDRLKNATRELADAEDAIVRLGRQLGRDFTRLTEAVDAVAPAPR